MFPSSTAPLFKSAAIQKAQNLQLTSLLPIVQLLSLILAAAASTTIATAVPMPEAFISVYTAPQCAKASTPGNVGDIIDLRDINLPLGKCVDITPLFTSFAAGLAFPCPAGQSPSVTAYLEEQCKGTNQVMVTQFPAGGQGECQNIVVGTATTPPTVGGKSAKFQCQ